MSTAMELIERVQARGDAEEVVGGGGVLRGSARKTILRA